MLKFKPGAVDRAVGRPGYQAVCLVEGVGTLFIHQIFATEQAAKDNMLKVIEASKIVDLEDDDVKVIF